MSRYGDAGWYRTENISYGQDNAQNVVVQLLIDDGLAIIQARDAVMSPWFGYTGIWTCPHSVYRTMTVVTYAERMIPNNYCLDQIDEFAANNPNPLGDENYHDDNDSTN